MISVMASQITSLTIVYSTLYSGAEQIKHQSSASLAFVRGIHRWPVNSPHSGPVTLKIFPFWWRHHENGSYWTHCGQDKMASIFEKTFKLHFLEWNCLYLYWYFTGPIKNNRILVQIRAWHRTGDTQLAEHMPSFFFMYMCVTRPQWVNLMDKWRVKVLYATGWAPFY